MSSEWDIVELGELTVNLDARRKPVKEADRKPGSYPYYGASGIVDYVDSFLFEGEHLLIAEDGENLRTRQTPVAFLANGKFWVNNHAHIVIGNDRASTRYLHYALLGTDISAYLTGAVMPKLTQGNLNRIEIPCPPQDIQAQIVSILGSLDDRIALLRETNATLESIAQAMFKSWFIDFDPVKAKQQGLEPQGMDAATAALFPDAFQDSDLGPIPAGWEVRRIEQIAEKVAMGPFGSNIKVSTFVDKGVPIISGQHLRNVLIEDLSFNFITENHAEKLKNSCVQAGDLVFTHAGNIGQASLIHEDGDFDKYVLSQRQFYLRCDKSKTNPSWLIYFFISSIGQQALLANTSQVGVPSIAKPVTYLRSIKIVIPPLKLMDFFSDKIDILHKQIISQSTSVRL